jgi:diguanylate cyclase (GGDEF)-like protein
LVGGSAPIWLAAFAPAAEVDRPVSRSERLLAACLAVTFVALLLLASLLARPAFVPLMRLARDARSSGTDDLTNLANRRAFTEAAAAELVRARRSGRPLAVALVDIDDFKRVNDTFGHSTGDRILCGLADVLREHFREIDLPARLGGDEFAVLLPDTDVAGSREAAERFVTAVADREFGDGRTSPHGITASAGVAAAANLEIGVLLEAADRALYRAKEHGKNQVQVEAV